MCVCVCACVREVTTFPPPSETLALIGCAVRCCVTSPAAPLSNGKVSKEDVFVETSGRNTGPGAAGEKQSRWACATLPQQTILHNKSNRLPKFSSQTDIEVEIVLSYVRVRN